MRFDSYHPMINLIYFASVIAASIAFRHPVFLAISYFCAFAYSVKLNGRRALIFNFCLIPLMVAWTLWYATCHHFGVTPLRRNFAGNEITLESLVYGGVTGVVGAAALMWMSCVHAVFCTDKIVYLFGRVSPKLSLFFSILLRAVPRIKAQARRIAAARRCSGRGIDQGNPFRRIANAAAIFSILITWTIESFTVTSDSMRARGYTLKGRTAFSIYRFDNRDRSFVIMIFICLTLLFVGNMFSQTNILYDPRIIMNRVTPLSCVFYLGYAVLCLLPMGLQIAGEARHKRQVGAMREFPIGGGIAGAALK